MKKFLFCSCYLLSQVAFAQPNPLATQYAQLITAAELKDNLSIISKETLGAVGTTLMNVVYFEE